ncbi:MAG TPA: glutamate-5-semialdehyde dehydrogenase, partial [Actinomycetota bacterium]|nr:glutamate-5-semialdehyde dehydrogenase [Actinomycetota bacterium]
AEAAGASGTVVDRLTLTDKRIGAMASALEAVSRLPDPVGEVVEEWSTPTGLTIQRVRASLGVVAVIYEARPNVTADVAGLCLKAGTACILRGSSIAHRSNRAISAALRSGLATEGLVEDALQLVDDTGRAAALELMRSKGLIDLLVPRGGRALIESIENNATVPYIVDGDGNCHVYVDAAAEPDMARRIVLNAKTQRPSVCNAAETLLVHEAQAGEWLQGCLAALAAAGVEVRGDERVRAALAQAQPVSERDWATEYLDLVLAVRVVASLDEAIAHVNRYGTSNAEAIVTEDPEAAARFVREVDSGSVFVNASTRFSDGGEFGFGAEIGISTQKLHARGPMGARELTSIKSVVWGSGQVRE